MYRNNRLKTMDNYYLMKGGKVIAGKGLECDYLLEDIKFTAPIKKDRN